MLFSGAAIRLRLKSPAGRPVYDWRLPVPSACHLLTCLTGQGELSQTHSLDAIFYSWSKMRAALHHGNYGLTLPGPLLVLTKAMLF